jgi:hypothetical protein
MAIPGIKLSHLVLCARYGGMITIGEEGSTSSTLKIEAAGSSETLVFMHKLHSNTSQMMIIFIVTTVKTSDVTYFNL